MGRCGNMYQIERKSHSSSSIRQSGCDTRGVRGTKTAFIREGLERYRPLLCASGGLGAGG